MVTNPFPTWDTHKAKDNLSKLLADAQHQEQVILRYGKPFAVVVSYDDYIAHRGSTASAWDFFKTISVEQTVEPPERSEQMRDIEL